MTTLPLFFALIIGAALGQETSDVADKNVREPRSLLKKKLCYKYGVCGQGGHQGGHQGGFHGGQDGYQGYQGVPINIAISQSQSSANGADGSHGPGYYPNNYQYNGGYPNQGYHQGHGGYPNQGYESYSNHGYGGYQNQGYGGYQGQRPGYFGNGQGSYNYQFNGNYHGGQQGGGYGFQRPFGKFDSDESDSHEEEGFGFGRSLATSKSKA